MSCQGRRGTAASGATVAAQPRPGAAGQDATQVPVRFGAVFAIVTAGIAVVNLDLFIVNVALPSIGRGFSGAGLADLSWVLNAYAIVFAALLVPAGRAADLIGRRAAFLTGMIVFGLASAACAAAPDVWVLVAARVVQAAGGALLDARLPRPAARRGPAGKAHRHHQGLDLGRRRRRGARPGTRRRAGRRQLALGVPGQRPHRADRRGRGPADPPS